MSKPNRPVYRVEIRQHDGSIVRRMIAADSQAQAIRHACIGTISAKALTPWEVVSLAGEGIKPEIAGVAEKGEE